MKRIKFFVMDVDGTLTDGKIYMGNAGESFKAFNAKDGYGIHGMLPRIGITPVIITGRTSQIVKNRCAELDIEELHQGVKDKLETLNDILIRNCASLDEVAYIGDDLNDMSCIRAVKAAGGLTGCPADAVGQVREIADFIAERNGGDGAVREFIEWLIIRL